MRSLPLSSLVLAGVTLSLASDGCAPRFDPQSKVQSVRILAVRADHPYSAPGSSVTLDVLAYDGRASRKAPMTVSWLPQPCVDPAGDDYYACFPAFAQTFRPNVDLSSQLVKGTSFSFAMPADAISSHGTTTGGAPYGLAITFVVACAGHVEYAPPATAAVDAVPFGCFDDAGTRLGADDFVFGFSLVYAFSDRTNTNPVLDHLTAAGQPVSLAEGITVSTCTQTDASKCPATALDVVVPPSSQEVDPGAQDAAGSPLKEEIWVDYYVTDGKMKNDTVVLFDPGRGALSGTSDGLQAPSSAGDQQVWAVVHDNRGGVDWKQVTLHVQ